MWENSKIKKAETQKIKARQNLKTQQVKDLKCDKTKKNLECKFFFKQQNCDNNEFVTNIWNWQLKVWSCDKTQKLKWEINKINIWQNSRSQDLTTKKKWQC